MHLELEHPIQLERKKIYPLGLLPPWNLCLLRPSQVHNLRDDRLRTAAIRKESDEKVEHDMR